MMSPQFDSAHLGRSFSSNLEFDSAACCRLVVETFKNSSAERVQPGPIYCRYISKRYIHSRFRYIAHISQMYHRVAISGFGMCCISPSIEFTMNIAPVHISTCHPEVEELLRCQECLRINKTFSHVICAEVG